jgi:6,7-dimethyl-8-ribityllumazine synthase
MPEKNLMLGLVLLGAVSCSKAPPPDPICRYEPAPESAAVPAGQGAIQIAGSTDEYFYILDTAGKEITHGRLNTSVPLKPGEYQAKVNNSLHPVFVQAKSVTKCSCGTFVLIGSTDEYYYILDSAAKELAHAKLGKGLAFFPGKYTVKANNTTAETDVKVGAVSEIKAGILNVRGSTDEYYYLVDAAGKELSHAKLSSPLALLAGSYTAKINNTSKQVQTTPGNLTALETGALLVRGSTDEYYYALDAAGTELAHQKLNSPLSFVEGAYTVKVNNKAMPVKVESAKTNEYQTATVTVRGSADAYYYLLDANGTELAHNKLNQPLAVPEGNYSVKVDKDTRPVTATSAKTTVVNW